MVWLAPKEPLNKYLYNATKSVIAGDYALSHIIVVTGSEVRKAVSPDY
jgi:hypothetical protein